MRENGPGGYKSGALATLRVLPATSISGTIRPPSDKSLTHRGFLFAGIAQTPSRIAFPLLGEDCVSTLRCLMQLGCNVEADGDGIIIQPSAWRSPAEDLDCGNSGTTMRLLAGILASKPGVEARLVGDESLSRRPMGRIVTPLRLMGGQLEGEKPPLQISGRRLEGIHYDSPVASAQVKSAILLAGLNANGKTSVTEPSLSRDHTERMFTALGVPLMRDGLTVSILPSTFDGFEFRVPADISSAAFWMVAAAALEGSNLTLEEIGTNPSRTGIFQVLNQAGVFVSKDETQTELGEPMTTLVIENSLAVTPFVIEGDLVPRLIDEIPVLAVLATQLEGTSEIRDAQELRVKESDRIAKTTEFLTAMGANVEALEDGLRIHGPTPLHGGTIHADGDHRIAMSAAIAGLIAKSGETLIEGAESIETSYPDFTKHMEQIVVR